MVPSLYLCKREYELDPIYNKSSADFYFFEVHYGGKSKRPIAQDM